MSKLTKIAAAAAVIAAAGYAGASWWMGQQAERHTDQALNWVKDKLGEHAVVQSNYQRGLFSDENTIVVELKRPPKAAQSAAAKAGEGHESQAENSRESQADSSAPLPPVRFHISQHVSHGALGVTTRLKLAKVEGLPDEVRQAFAQAEPPEVTLHRPLAGDMTAQLLLPAGRFAVQQPGQPASQASWQPLTYDLRLSQDRQRLSGQVDFKGMEMTFAPAAKASEAAPKTAPKTAPETAPDAAPEAAQTAPGPGGQPAALQMRVGGMQGQFSADIGAGLWLLAPGQQEGRVASMQASMGGKDLFRFDQLTYKVDTTRQGDAISSHGHYATAGEIGGVALQALSYDVQLDKISAAALLQAQQMLARAWGALTDKSLQGEERQAALQAMQEQFKGETEALLQELLAGEPAVQVRYGATIDQQAGSLEYSVALAAADAQAKESPIQLPAMFKLMQRASIKASLHIPRAWSAVVAKMAGDPRVSAESLEQMADGFAAQGFVKNENGAWSAHFEVEPGGKMLLNGQPLMR